LRKQNKPTLNCRKEYKTLRNELESKLDEELMDKIENILSDCGELVI